MILYRTQSAVSPGKIRDSEQLAGSVSKRRL